MFNPTFAILLLCVFCTLSNAKNLYVSPSGDDSVTYLNNDMAHPWQTPERVWGYYDGAVNYPNSELPVAGDVVFFRQGTYNIARTVGSKYIGNDGTEISPVTFRNYETETVNISGHGNPDTGNSSLIVIEHDYYNFEGLNFTGSGFRAGGAILYFSNDASAIKSKVEKCTFRITSSNSLDNVACVIINDDADGTLVTNNVFVGFDSATCAGILVFRTEALKLENNEFQALGNGIFLKHSNSLTDTGISFSGNYMHDCACGIRTVSNYARIENNLLVGCPILLGDDGGMGDGYTGADYNTIKHNTVFNGRIELLYQTRDEDPNKGCLFNIIRDNIIMQHSGWHEYAYSYPGISDLAYESDYNLYPAGNILTERGINYTLTTWRSHNNNDENSLSGAPAFTGGANPSTISGFALASGSAGKNAASDQTDIGANINFVGTTGMSTDTTTPAMPSGLQVR